MTRSLSTLRRAFVTTTGLVANHNAPLYAVRTTPPIPNHGSPLPPLVFLHGLLASELTTRSLRQREDLAPKREKIGVDLRNHGRSFWTSARDMTYDEMSDDVIYLLDNLSVHTAVLVGHSMGGKVAMHTALRHPSRVSQLVVADVAPVSYKPRKHASDGSIAARAMAAVNLADMTSREQVDDALAANGVNVRGVRQFIMTNLVRQLDEDGKFQQYQWKANVHVLVESLPTLMGFPPHGDGVSYTGKTCLIRGGQSRYVPFSAMQQVISLFPNTKLVTLSDAGHWVQTQMPDDFCRSVNDFLAD